jgi:GNAT superfamily N-acetyltransferase
MPFSSNLIDSPQKITPVSSPYMNTPSLSFQILTPNASISTFEALSHLAKKTFSDAFGHLYTEEVLASYLEQQFNITHLRHDATKEGTLYGLVYVNQTLAGYFKCLCHSTKYLDEIQCQRLAHQGHTNLCFLERLYFDTDYHGTGIAQVTMAYILQMAKYAWHMTHIHLTVWEHNIKAQRLYQHWGLKTMGQTLFYVDQAKPDIEYIYGRAL